MRWPLGGLLLGEGGVRGRRSSRTLIEPLLPAAGSVGVSVAQHAEGPFGMPQR